MEKKREGAGRPRRGPLFWIDCVNINSGQVRDAAIWSVILMQLWAQSGPSHPAERIREALMRIYGSEVVFALMSSSRRLGRPTLGETNWVWDLNLSVLQQQTALTVLTLKMSPRFLPVQVDSSSKLHTFWLLVWVDCYISGCCKS